jgi:hypothetical protein
MFRLIEPSSGKFINHTESTLIGCAHFGSHNVHIYWMFLRFGLWIGLMMAQWAETCCQIYRLIIKLFAVFRLNIIIFSKPFCQEMHPLLKHKMSQFTLKMSLYMAPTCFGPFGPSSRSVWRNLAKVRVFVEIISKNTSLKLLLCSGNMYFSL